MDSVGSRPADRVPPPKARPLFDDRAVYRLLEQRLLPELIERRDGAGRRLRLWSAACDGGGEPYSLALLLRALLPDPADWQITVLGSDSDPGWFPQPRQPLFDDAALAAAPPAVRQSGLCRAGSRWTLASAVRRWIEFAHIDLHDDAVPSLINGTVGLDLVLCRGPLYALPAEQAGRVLGKLARALAPGGCLLLDRPPAVPVPNGLRLAPADGCWLLVRAAGRASEPDDPSADFRPVDAGAALDGERAAAAFARALIDYRQGRFDEARQLLQAAARSGPQPAASLALLARIEAVQGHIDDARAWCELAVASDEPEPAHHCLRACILQEQGAFGEAMQAYQRALCLDPGFMLAHFGLGRLARRLGRLGEAERHCSNALALARGFEPGTVLAHADGLTAGRLAAIIAALQGNEDASVGPN